MKDWSTKTLYRTDMFGVPLASDLNSDFNECENVVKPFQNLNVAKNTQMVDSINVLSKQRFYKNIGDANYLVLVRTSFGAVIEKLNDGMVLFYKPTEENTGAVKAQISNLRTVSLKNGGKELEAGYLNTRDFYMLIYSESRCVFDVYNITGNDSGIYHGNPNHVYKVKDGVTNRDAVNVSQLTSKMKKDTIITDIHSTASDKPISAKMGVILKSKIDGLNYILTSNDISLDTLQEIVDYIKVNRNGINSVTVASFIGLQEALDGKANIGHNHDDRYYTKDEVTQIVNDRAEINGDETVQFQVAPGADPDQVVNLHQLNSMTHGTLWNYKETTDPLVTTNPSALGATWIDTTTGEIFMCINNTTDKNIWKGTNGTIVGHIEPTYGAVDIFNDGSGIALYEFEGNVNDTGGLYNGVKLGTLDYPYNDKMVGAKSVFNNSDGLIKIHTGTVGIKTVSLWVKITALSETYNTIMDNRVDENTASNPGMLRTNKGTSNYNMALATSIIKVDKVTVHNNTTEHITDSRWHHIIIELDSKETIFGFAGVENTSPLPYCLNGYLDQIRLFNRDLTDAEVEILFDEPNH